MILIVYTRPEPLNKWPLRLLFDTDKNVIWAFVGKRPILKKAKGGISGINYPSIYESLIDEDEHGKY